MMIHNKNVNQMTGMSMSHGLVDSHMSHICEMNGVLICMDQNVGTHMHQHSEIGGGAAQQNMVIGGSWSGCMVGEIHRSHNSRGNKGRSEKT